MALVAISSFILIFFSGILWASRRPADTHH